MNFISIVSEIAYILNAHCEFPVMTEYPDSSADRNSMYAVAGLKSAKIDYINQLSNTNYSIPLNIQLKISLFAPQHTNYEVFYNAFQKNILSTLSISDINISEISVSDIQHANKLNQLEMYALINIDGISEV